VSANVSILASDSLDFDIYTAAGTSTKSYVSLTCINEPI
jgi:hypothetical protein